MATNMIPGTMPQGSQNSFLQPQPAIYPTAYLAAPNVGAGSNQNAVPKGQKTQPE